MPKTFFDRTVDGIADAAAFCSMTSILLVLYPDNVGTVMATSETVWGVGYAMGKSEYIHQNQNLLNETY